MKIQYFIIRIVHVCIVTNNNKCSSLLLLLSPTLLNCLQELRDVLWTVFASLRKSLFSKQNTRIHNITISNRTTNVNDTTNTFISMLRMHTSGALVFS